MPPPAPGAGAAALADLSQAVEELGRAVKDRLGPSLADTTIKITALGVVLNKLGAVEDVIKPLARSVTEAFRRLADVDNWLKPFTVKIRDYFERNAPAWVKGLEVFGGHLVAMTDRFLKPATIGLVNFAKVSTSVAASIGVLAAGAGIAAGAVAALASVTSGLVAKANPAIVEQFSFAMNDLQAVIGQGLAPAFKILTDLVRTFADTLATFMPELGGAVATVLKPLADTLKVLFEVFGNVAQVAAKVLGAVAPAFAALGEAFNAVLRAILPVVNLIVDVFGGVLVGVMRAFAAVVETVVPPVVALIEIIGDLVRWVIQQVRDLLEFLGLLDPETPGTEKGKSFGASARAAGTSSIEGVLQKARESAFTLGNAAGGDPALAIGKGIHDKVADIKGYLKSLPKEIGNAVAEALGIKGATDFVSDTLEGARGAADFIADSVIPSPATGDPIGRHTDAARDWLRRRAAGGGGTVPDGGP